MDSGIRRTATATVDAETAGYSRKAKARGMAFVCSILILVTNQFSSSVDLSTRNYATNDYRIERNTSSLSNNGSQFDTNTTYVKITRRTNHTYDHNMTRNHQRAVYGINEEYFIWSNGRKICQLIQNITNLPLLGSMIGNLDSNKDGPFPTPYYMLEEDIFASTSTATATNYTLAGVDNVITPLIKLTLNCSSRLEHTGNWITAIYHLRLAVVVIGNLDFGFQCQGGGLGQEEDATALKYEHEHILPWLTGFWRSTQSQPHEFGVPKIDQVCSKKYKNLPLHHLTYEIQYDMRKLAMAILGPRKFPIHNNLLLELEKGWTLMQQQQEYQSLSASPAKVGMSFPRTDLDIDDVAIHFRCGDVLGGTNKDTYGIIPFREYVHRISERNDKNSSIGIPGRGRVRSIGIFTQSFNQSLVRKADRDQVDKCREVVGALVDYLSKHLSTESIYDQNQHDKQQSSNETNTSLPKITIRNTIHEDGDDSIPITYARMIMAKYVFSTASTFGVFPTMSTFGEGFYFQGGQSIGGGGRGRRRGHLNDFVRYVPRILSNVHVIDTVPFLSSRQIKQISWKKVMSFLLQDP